ncbi:MAG: hypothetical protein NZZ41_01775 [Candidatus Dojkabacteria bacterium]|nr:hypothetical protein [Candidatus Dojkabacteria bacterium]
MLEKDFYKDFLVNNGKNVQLGISKISKKHSRKSKILLYIMFGLSGLIIGLILTIKGFFLEHPPLFRLGTKNVFINNYTNNRLSTTSRMNNNLDSNSSKTTNYDSWGYKISSSYVDTGENYVPILFKSDNKSLILFIIKDSYYLLYSLDNLRVKDLKLYSTLEISYVDFDSEKNIDRIVVQAHNKNSSFVIYESQINKKILSHFFDHYRKVFFLLEEHDNKVSLKRVDLQRNINELHYGYFQLDNTYKIVQIVDNGDIFVTNGSNCLRYSQLNKQFNTIECKYVYLNNDGYAYFRDNNIKHGKKGVIYMSKNNQINPYFNLFPDNVYPDMLRVVNQNKILFTVFRNTLVNGIYIKELLGIYTIQNNTLQIVSSIFPSYNLLSDIEELFIVDNYLYVIGKKDQTWKVLYIDLLMLQQNGQSFDNVDELWLNYLSKEIFSELHILDIIVLSERFDSKIFE